MGVRTNRLLGDAHVRLGDHEDGITHLRQALAHARQHRDSAQEALELYREQGRDTDADRVRRQLDTL